MVAVAGGARDGQTDLQPKKVVPDDRQGAASVREAVGGVESAEGCDTARDPPYDGPLGERHTEERVGEVEARLGRDGHPEGLRRQPRQHVVRRPEQRGVGRADEGAVRLLRPMDDVQAVRQEPRPLEADGRPLRPKARARDGQRGVAGNRAPHGHGVVVVATGDAVHHDAGQEGEFRQVRGPALHEEPRWVAQRDLRRSVRDRLEIPGPLRLDEVAGVVRVHLRLRAPEPALHVADVDLPVDEGDREPEGDRIPHIVDRELDAVPVEHPERLRRVAPRRAAGLHGARDVVHRRRHVAQLHHPRRERAVELHEAQVVPVEGLHPRPALQALREPPAGGDVDPRGVRLHAGVRGLVAQQRVLQRNQRPGDVQPLKAQHVLEDVDGSLQVRLRQWPDGRERVQRPAGGRVQVREKRRDRRDGSAQDLQPERLQRRGAGQRRLRAVRHDLRDVRGPLQSPVQRRVREAGQQPRGQGQLLVREGGGVRQGVRRKRGQDVPRRQGPHGHGALHWVRLGATGVAHVHHEGDRPRRRRDGEREVGVAGPVRVPRQRQRHLHGLCAQGAMVPVHQAVLVRRVAFRVRPGGVGCGNGQGVEFGGAGGGADAQARGAAGDRGVVDGGGAVGVPRAAVAGVRDRHGEVVLRRGEARGGIDEGEAVGAGTVRLVEEGRARRNHVPGDVVVRLTQVLVAHK